MKKLLTFIGLCVILMGCDDPYDHLKTVEGTTPLGDPPKKTYSVDVIDGCEYFIMWYNGVFYPCAHKGNCTNNIHIYRVEK
jgi:hypothetical protein